MEKNKIKDYEFLLKEYQVDTLLDILREFFKANIDLVDEVYTAINLAENE